MLTMAFLEFRLSGFAKCPVNLTRRLVLCIAGCGSALEGYRELCPFAAQVFS
jgi:hypothetical protein